jgi:hypothetical protein
VGALSQNAVLSRVRDQRADGFTGIAEHAVDGWPPAPADGWDTLRTRYLHSIEEAKRIAGNSDSLGKPVLQPGVGSTSSGGR